MNKVHKQFQEKEMHTSDFINTAQKISGKNQQKFISQWLKRDDLPDLQINAEQTNLNNKWQVSLNILQPDNYYHFFSTVKIETEKEITYKIIEVSGKTSRFNFEFEDKSLKLTFNALNDIPLNYDNYFTWSNFYDDWFNTIIVYGTKRQIEANHTLALRFSTMLADRYSETLMPIRKDSEITEKELKNNDLIILGNTADNGLLEDVISKLNLQIKKNMYYWNDQDYGRSDEGLYASFPNPYSPGRAAHLLSSNSALQLYQMTKDRNRIPSWAIFKGDKIEEKGYHVLDKYVIEFEGVD